MRGNRPVTECENHFQNIPYSEITLLCNGRAQCTPEEAVGPRISEDYLFHLILRGGGVLTLDGLRYPLSAGQGFFIAPGQLYQCRASRADPWEYLWFGFKGNGVRALLYHSRLMHMHPIYESDAWPELADFMLRGLRAASKGDIASAVQCQGLFHLALAHLIRETPLFPNSAEYAALTSVQTQYIYSAIEYIHENIARRFAISDVAASLGLDRSYFSRLFSQLCGTTPSRFISDYRLDVAWHMIRRTDMPIGKIAQAVGFADAAYFARCFQKRYNQAPSRLRALAPRASESPSDR